MEQSVSPYLQTKPKSRAWQPQTPSRPSQSPLKERTPLCRLSPSKSPLRKTPLAKRAPAQSPRKSPFKSGFQAVNKVSFTPQRVKQLPRAWERQPATPFIPRDDKQKIWKRVPLGELGVDVNRPAGISRRQQDERKDYMRVVKKLKVGHGANEEDKENVLLTAKASGGDCDMEAGDIKPERPNYVSMRMEEDEIWGSPRKKLTQHPGLGAERQSLKEEGNYAEDLQDEMEDLDDADSDAEKELEDDEDQHVGSLAEDGQQLEEEREESTEATVTEPEILPIEATDMEMVASIRQDNVSDEYTADAIKDSSPAIPAATAAELPHATEQETAFSKEIMPQGALSLEDLPSSDGLDAQDGISPKDQRSSSPPTIVAENVLVDELAVKQPPRSPKAQNVEDNTIAKKMEVKEGEAPSQLEEAVPRRISDDEAAFLRDFMSRSKASKAAREQALQNITQEEAKFLQDQGDISKSGQEAASDEAIIHISASPVKLGRGPVDEEPTPTSPLRRSKRAAVTNIPRAQPTPAPNAIHLKRANGNEFIFTANKASSAANTALTTRTNTKKNKGSALNVHDRLEQLLAERAKEDNGQADLDRSEHKANVPGKGASKKRKRNGDKQKVTKVLRWNEECLVTYQEAEQSSTEELEDIDDTSQENMSASQPSEIHHHHDDAGKRVKLTMTMSKKPSRPSLGMGDLLSTLAESWSTDSATASTGSPQRKVRRVRRGIVGSVNGTPAPKTRSKSAALDLMDDSTFSLNMALPEGEEPTFDLSTSGSARAAVQALSERAQTLVQGEPENGNKAASAATTQRKSRVPMPSGSGVRKPGASGVPSRAAGARAQDKSKSDISKSGAPAQAGESGSADVLGRRRLRVRS